MSSSMAETPVALKLSRILAPVDFSDRCLHAAECAEGLARHFEAELVLLHAVAPLTLPFGAPEALTYSETVELMSERIAGRTALLEAFLADRLRGLSTRRVVVEDDPAAAIAQYASEHSCDLIVMPTHGYGALRRLVAGSVAVEVLSHTHCPVWTGSHFDEAPKTTFQNILCALDLASSNRAVLAWAAGFAREFGAALKVVHAIPMSTVRSGPLYFDPDWHIHVAADARRRIVELQHDLRTTAEIDIELGDIPGAVVTAARDSAADLLVIGRGPKAYSLIRDAPCPVVAV